MSKTASTKKTATGRPRGTETPPPTKAEALQLLESALAYAAQAGLTVEAVSGTPARFRIQGVTADEGPTGWRFTLAGSAGGRATNVAAATRATNDVGANVSGTPATVGANVSGTPAATRATNDQTAASVPLTAAADSFGADLAAV